MTKVLPSGADRDTGTVDSFGKRALVVLGMHRSGTSALSRTLSFLKFSQATDLMPPRDDNPKGFWEPMGVVRLNERILFELGSGWDRPPLLYVPGKTPLESAADIDALVIARYLQDAVAALRASYGDERRIVLKDPRIALFPALWDLALREAGFTPTYVLIVRNPLEVAASLNVRNNLGRPRSLQLWQRYNLSALTLTRRGLLDTVVLFDDLLARKAAVIRELGDAFGIPAALLANDDPELTSFLDPADRHQTVENEKVFNSPMVPVLTKETYRLLLEWNKLGRAARDERIVRAAAQYEEFCLLSGTLTDATVNKAAASTAPSSRDRDGARMPRRRLLLHYHIFKNAGTSVDSILKQNFPVSWVGVEFSESPHLHPDAIRRFILDNPAVSAISSHTVSCPPPAIDCLDILPVIFVRHPIDRLRSAYEFERAQDADTFGARLAKEVDFVGYVQRRWDKPGDRAARNLQAHRLARVLPNGSDDERTAALEALDRLPFVGLVEAFDRSVERLQSLARLLFPEFRGHKVWKNATRDTTPPLAARLKTIREDVGDTFYRTIEANNEVDLELYEEMCRRYGVAGSPQP